jgi:ribosomal protein L37E
MMIILTYILVPLVLVAAVVCIILLVDRHRRKEYEKAKAAQIREANRPVEVWICRYCGFMSLMKNQTCSRCGNPRPEEFLYRTIAGKDFAAQLRKPAPPPFSNGPGKSA